jgi:hypothetical protein
MQAMTLAVPPQTRHVSTSISPKAPTLGENPLQPLRPGHGRMTLNWRLLLLAIRCFGLVAFSPFCRCHNRPVFAVRGEYTVKARQVDSGPGHKSCQFGDEIHRLKDDVGGPIPIRRLQLIADLTLIRQ